MRNSLFLLGASLSALSCAYASSAAELNSGSRNSSINGALRAGSPLATLPTTPAAMDRLERIRVVTRQQAKDYPSCFIGESTLRALCTAIGFPNTDTAAVTTGTKSAPLAAIVNSINVHIGTPSDTSSSVGSNPTVFSVLNNLNDCCPSTSANSQMLTRAVDNLMDHVFGFNALSGPI